MKVFLYTITTIFMIIGIVLLALFAIKIFYDDKLLGHGFLDFSYLKTLGESAQILAISWSIIGVFLLIITLNIQKEQFSDNKNFIEKQQFETTFFNMLNVLYNIKVAMKKELIIATKAKLIEGQNLIDSLKEELAKEYNAHFKNIEDKIQINEALVKITNNIRLEALELSILKDEIEKVYITFYKTYHSELGHFFRYLFNLIRFTIDNREKNQDDTMYINLIQAQLSNNELALVFYNVLSGNSLNKDRKPEFYNILEKYSFFENIDQNALLDRRHHVLFPKTKFKFLNRDEISLKNN